MATTPGARAITAAAISGVLRRSGFNPVAPSDHQREGLKVKRSVRDSVRVVADLNSDADARIMSENAYAALEAAGYTVERSEGDEAGFYVLPVSSAPAAVTEQASEPVVEKPSEETVEVAEGVAALAHENADRLEIEAARTRAAAYELDHTASTLRAALDGTQAPEPGARLRGGYPVTDKISADALLRVLLSNGRDSWLERAQAEEMVEDLLAHLA